MVKKETERILPKVNALNPDEYPQITHHITPYMESISSVLPNSPLKSGGFFHSFISKIQ